MTAVPVLRNYIAGTFTDSADHLIERTRTTEMGERGEFAYSNLGISLLGEALARAAGADSWSSYITERLFTPSGMERTIISHGGITMEYVTHLAIDKESGTAVMVFTDQNNDGTASALAAALLTDGQKISAAHAPLSAEMLPQIMILGIFTILALVIGLYTAARAASVPSRMAAVCRAASLIACLMAAAASGPWAYLPGWILAVAASPGMYGVVRGIALWSELPALPRRRAWLGWMQVGLSAAFVGACLVVAWPKA